MTSPTGVLFINENGTGVPKGIKHEKATRAMQHPFIGIYCPRSTI
ncbi:hypothetical protein THF5H11_10469 [Vibrio jasicida]|uniref:Uncharacterized protein n=1 Tax=Vibrio jasicida TaxID=766224 RepID=A0AAU9QWI7_9VIBR|nr:hypothetical protein THF5H11_10469 [Vibrio jasicida]CAH1602401.1 hypothetical protein THF1C08_80191 [Vibrio jasicida]CAH1603472.1 hypothetical protein THF1A12_70191 [Vibrio jasicida]CAH1607621.1 hypothetical protein THF5G08_40381 [Vibrio jasicida]